MNTSIQDEIMVAGAIAGIVVCLFVVLDFLLNRWRWIKRIAVWLSKPAIKLRPDFGALSLQILPAPPTVALPVGTSDGVTKTPAKYIMCGPDQLLAYTIPREGFPGTHFLVLRKRPGQDNPPSIETPNRDQANAKWNEWYQEWKQKGFDGASGTGLSGEPPFGS